MKLRHQLLLVFFVLEACTFSLVLSSEMLPEKEMRELDIFMQDEEYNQISRTKRTENGNSEDEQDETEGSAQGDPKMMSPEDEEQNRKIISDVATAPVNSTSPTPTTQTIVTDSEENGNSSPSTDLSTPSPNQQTDSVDESYTYQRNTDVKVQASTPSVGDVAMEPETTNSSPFSTDPPENKSELNTESSGRFEPELSIRSGGPPVDVSNTTSFNVSETATNNTKQEIPEEVTTTQNVITHSIPEAMLMTRPVETTTARSQYDSEVNNTIVHNTTKTDTKGTKLDTPGAGGTLLTTTAKSVGSSESNVTSTPKAGESDLPNKSSVSGSGIFFTIIALVVIASLAAVGYCIYKKRQQGYDPVAVEDRDKEMIEIITGNGFGKPITVEEIRLADQLTPIEPKAAPRTFAIAPADEKALENVEVVKKDNEDRDKREQSVEFEEEANKKDEQ